jgi:hypothetical protein
MTALPPFRSCVVRAVLLGLPGVAVLPFAVEPPPGVPAAALAINPLVLLVLAGLAGAWAAPRIGAASAVILRSRLSWRVVMGALGAGLLLGAAVALVDGWLTPWWRGEAALPLSLLDAASPVQMLFGVLYGGFTEEVLMRWGLLSLLAAALIGLLPRAVALGIATVVAAALFAAAHLPALAVQGLEVTPGLLVRTLGFNTLLGLAFGWAFVRRGLEAAVGMHAGFHLGVAGTAALAAGNLGL